MATPGVLLPAGYETLEDNSGASVPGGLVWTYQAGTTTPVPTYTDRSLTVVNTNPIVCDGAGRWSAWGPANVVYKFVFEGPATPPAHGPIIKTVDGILGLTTPVVSTFVISTTSGVVDNWAPGLVGNTLLAIFAAAPLTITGFAGGVPGQELIVVNVGTSPVTFRYLTASITGNQLLTVTSSDVKLNFGSTANSSARFIYDGVFSRWVMTDLFSGDPIPYTPQLFFGGTATATGTFAGEYIQLNNRVFVTIRFTLTSKGAGVGAAGITLPMAARGNVGYPGIAQSQYYANMTSVPGGVWGLPAGSTSLQLWTPAATGLTSVTDANFTNTSDLMLVASYSV